MTDRLVISFAQLNPTVGDIAGNARLVREARTEAARQGADILLMTELFLTGYPPDDLVLKPSFVNAAREAAEALAAETDDGGPAVILGAPWVEEMPADRVLRNKVTNSVLVMDAGRIQAVRHKYELCNYGVLDEKRVFGAGPLPGPVNLRGVRIGIPICEDIWIPDVAECLAESGAEILLVPNGSFFEFDKLDQRQQLGLARIAETGLPLAYVNMLGGQDELVFDGGSFVLNADCSLAMQLALFEERLARTVWERGEDDTWACREAPLEKPSDGLESIYRALVLGLRDYVDKTGFPGVVLGLSGGIDSALTAAVAVDALGPDKVTCVMMPSPYTSRESLEDAAEAARLLGVTLHEIGIEPAMGAFAGMLEPVLNGIEGSVTAENIQARARGIALMAISNRDGSMVISTGNKSEMSVGYATLYGDMCGGFNVLKDIYKTTVFQLAQWRNQNRVPDGDGPVGRVIPERIITKPPSAELKPDQTDQDTLPPYDVLDGILELLVEDEMGLEDIVAHGYDRATVARVWHMLDLAEYKRRQAAPGVKITERAFGRDRRYPIVNRFKAPL